MLPEVEMPPGWTENKWIVDSCDCVLCFKFRTGTQPKKDKDMPYNRTVYRCELHAHIPVGPGLLKEVRRHNRQVNAEGGLKKHAPEEVLYSAGSRELRDALDKYYPDVAPGIGHNSRYYDPSEQDEARQREEAENHTMSDRSLGILFGDEFSQVLETRNPKLGDTIFSPVGERDKAISTRR